MGKARVSMAAALAFAWFAAFDSCVCAAPADELPPGLWKRCRQAIDCCRNKPLLEADPSVDAPIDDKPSRTSNYQPAAENPPSVDPIAEGLVEEMLTGSTPSQRHQAIRDTADCDWRKSPQIIAALVKTARLDSDRAVRVHAIRQLTQLKVDVVYAIRHLRYLKQDEDRWIREESAAAVDKLGRSN